MYSNEAVFVDEVVKILEKDRVIIEKHYRPFKNFKYSVDIKSIIKDIEEWRELKIIYYKGKLKSIQNLWKGFGKTLLMQDLADKEIESKEFTIKSILTIPEYA